MRGGGDAPMVYDLQKASMWKRISAFLFDGILLSVITVLIAWGLSALLGYDGYNRTVNESYERYGQEYQVDLRMTLTEYEALTPEEAQRVDEAFAAMNADVKALRAHQMMLQLSVLILSLGFFFAYLTLHCGVKASSKFLKALLWCMRLTCIHPTSIFLIPLAMRRFTVAIAALFVERK